MAEIRRARRAYPWYTGLLAGAVGYIAYIILCYALTGPILHFLDFHFPFTFFYHLHEDEADGPIGNIMMLATGTWIQILIFWVTFAPLALLSGFPREWLFILTFLNEFMLLVIIPSMVRTLFGHY